MDQLKDVILSTLAEIQEEVPDEIPKTEKKEKTKEPTAPKKKMPNDSKKTAMEKRDKKEESFFERVTASENIRNTEHLRENELLFLNSLRERLLVLFEGFQAPNNTSIEAKIDLTLNFLEYVLSVIEERIEHIKGR